jgi:hypothetical protein
VPVNRWTKMAEVWAMQRRTLLRTGPILLIVLISWYLLAMALAGVFLPTHWVERLVVFPMQAALPVFMVVLVLMAVGVSLLLLVEWLIWRKRRPNQLPSST